MRYFQESVDLRNGKNLQPIETKYSLPDQPSGNIVFFITGSFEYDIEQIKQLPPPRTHYQTIMIPTKFQRKVGPSVVTYQMSPEVYRQHVEYIQKQKMVPQLKIMKQDQMKTFRGNVYIPFSDMMKSLNQTYRSVGISYLETNAMNMMNEVLAPFGNGHRILIVNTDRFHVYQPDQPDAMNSDMVNAALQSYMMNPSNQKSSNTTFVFQSSTKSYKMDLKTIGTDSSESVQKMCDAIGVPFKGSSKSVSVDKKSIDQLMDDVKSDMTDVDQDVETPDISGGSGNQLRQSVQHLKQTLGVSENQSEKDALYSAKALQINASLIRRINPNTNMISDYKRIASDLTNGGDTPVENQIIDQASKTLADSREAIDDRSVMNTITSPREMKLRADIGQIRLKSLDINAVSTVTDVPKPAPVRPLRITTTNRGAMIGASFPNMAREYEEKMLDQDIVAAVMSLQKIDDGFDILGIDVDDISTPVSLMHMWKISLKNKRTGSQSHINIRVPKLINGRFFYNGVWRNIGKQDFPIPILKLNGKRVMLTSNYNKIDVQRYDTKSLVDITMMLKALASANQPDGKNPYIQYGSSITSNRRFVSTIEYDEYAKRWFTYTNQEMDAKIIFNREQCAKEYEFVNVNENEFCCGMINKVPVVLNTETGLDRHGRTLTDVIASTLPEPILKLYKKAKPSKLSMYSEMKIGNWFPIGVAIAGWEGISSLLKRSGADYKRVNGTEDTPGYFKIQFSDQTLAIRNTIQNQLLFNGFYRLNPKQYSFADMDVPISKSNSVFVDIFNQLFFKQYSQLTLFLSYYDFFVDPITDDVCQHYKIPNQICDMLIYASNLLADDHFSSENNASLYRIRSSEILPAIIHNHLAAAVSRYNNQVGSQTRDRKLQFNQNDVIQTLLNIQTVTPLSALNPMVELHEREIVSKKGFHGVNTDRGYTQAKRSYEDTMVGKIALSSPNNGNVGINRQMVVDPKLESVRGYTSTQDISTDFNDLQLASFSELMTPGTVSRDDAIRTAIATSQTSHILPTDDAEPVLVSNGIDELVPSYLSEEFAVTARDDGKVLEITDGYMIVEYKDKSKQAIPVSDRYSFNDSSGFYVDNKLKSNFDPNDTFQKNDILAYHEKFFTKDSSGMVRMNIGPLAKVAFAGLYSTYEDAGLITSKMSKRLSSSVTMCQATKLNATDDIESIVKVGDEVEIGDPLIVFGLGDTGDRSVDIFLKAFQNQSNILDTAKKKIISKHAGRVVDIRMYTTKSMDRLSPYLFDLLDTHFKENINKRKILDKYDKSDRVYKLDTMYTLPTRPLSGSTIKGITCDVLIEIYIEHTDDVSIGDKCVVYAASKQVISEVIPEGLEPYAESNPDEEISMFVSPRSILARMTPSMLITVSANKILIELKKKIRDIWGTT